MTTSNVVAPEIQESIVDMLAEGASIYNVQDRMDEWCKINNRPEFEATEKMRIIELAMNNAARQISQSLPQHMESPQKPQGLHVINAADFLTMQFPQRGFVLEPVIPTQGLAMIYAPRGIGKTWAALSMAWAVATGGMALGRWQAPEARHVLYLDGEMPAGDLQERLASVIAGSDKESPDSNFMRVVNGDLQMTSMLNLATPEGQNALEPFLKDVDLVVVDNLATLARRGRENETESWLPMQSWLLDLRRRGKSVLLVHHAGKGGQQRGTSAREDVLDTVIALRKPSDYSEDQGARFEVHLEKSRGVCGDAVQPFETLLTGNQSAVSWTTRDLANADLERVRELLSEGLSVRDIAEETGISKSKVARLKKSIEEGSR